MRRMLVLVLITAAACGERPAPAGVGSGTAAATAPEIATGPATFAGELEAPASVRSASELKVRLTITNPGPGELTLTRGAVDLAVLALEVRDAGGRRMPTIPPPVPRESDAERIVIPAGGTLVRDYLMNVYSPDLPPGEYELHCRMVACRAARFTVAP